MDRRAAWVLGLIFGGLFLSLFGFLFILYLAVQSGDSMSAIGADDRVGVVEVMGPIADSKKTIEELREFADADRIKAIVVRVDSPGGAVGPSQEIFDTILSIREKKTVLVSMGSMAASGGFYIACAGEKVFANPGTLTGSIGVIMQVPNVAGVLKWAGVEMNTITAGKLKDSGSPYREMTAEERAYFQSVLSDVHEQFITSVARGRGLDDKAVRPYADGRVFSGRQAREWKLVDELGGLEAAVAEAGRMAKISGKPEIEYPREKRKLLMELLGADEPGALLKKVAASAVEALGGQGLQYRLPLGGR